MIAGTSEENVGRFSNRKNSTDAWIGGALAVNDITKRIVVRTNFNFIINYVKPSKT